MLLWCMGCIKKKWHWADLFMIFYVCLHLSAYRPGAMSLLSAKDRTIWVTIWVFLLRFKCSKTFQGIKNQLCTHCWFLVQEQTLNLRSNICRNTCLEQFFWSGRFLSVEVHDQTFSNTDWMPSVFFKGSLNPKQRKNSQPVIPAIVGWQVLLYMHTL